MTTVPQQYLQRLPSQAEDESSLPAVRRQARAEWAFLWAVIVPTLIVAVIVRLAPLGGVKPVVMIGVALPVMFAAAFNPFLGLTMLMALLPLDDFLNVGVETKFTLSKAVAIPTFLGFLMQTTRRKYSLLPADPIGKAALVFAGLATMSTVWSVSPLLTLVHLPTFFMMWGVILMAAQVVDKPHRWRIVLMAIAISAMMYGIFAVFRLGPAAVYEATADRVGGAGKGAGLNNQAMILSWVIVSMIGFTFLTRSRIQRLIAWSSVFFCMMAILLIKSRTQAIALPVAVSVGVVFGLRSNPGVKVVILGTIAAALGVLFTLGAVLGVVNSKDAFSRFTAGGLQDGAQIRTYLWETAALTWLSTPVSIAVGGGWGTYGMLSLKTAGTQGRLKSTGGVWNKDVHSMYLGTLAELGLAGFFVLLFIIGFGVKAAFETRAGPVRFVQIAGAMIFLMGGMTNSILAQKSPFYCLGMVAAAAMVFPKKEPEITPALAQGNTAAQPYAHYLPKPVHVPGYRR